MRWNICTQCTVDITYSLRKAIGKSVANSDYAVILILNVRMSSSKKINRMVLV